MVSVEVKNGGFNRGSTSTASPKDQRDRTDGDDQPEDLVQRKLQNPTRIVVSVIYPLVI